MDRLAGVYEGRIVSVGDGNASAFVPQVFGETTIVISNFLGDPLTVKPGRGWVSFQSGDPEHPVWMSGIGGGSSTTPGPPGPVGPPGPTATVSFIHNQGTVAAVWTITHNLGWYPNVTVVDSGGSTVEGELVHLTTLALRLTFSGAFSGVAYLS